MLKLSQPMRVLQVTARFFPFIGGTETHVYEISRRLAEAGVDLTVLTADPTGQLAPLEEMDGIQVRRVPAWPRGKDYYYAPGVSNVIRENQWDLVHCQSVHTFVPGLAMAASRRACLPYLVTFHAGGHSSRLRNSLRSLQWRVLRPLLVRAERLIGVSQYEVDLFSRVLDLPADRFVVIPNGSDLPLPEQPGFIDPEQLVLISIGRLERYKGHQRVIAALPFLLEQFPNLHLLILGSGPYEADLRLLAEQLGVASQVEIRAIPPGERARMAETMACASLVVLLSERESHPVAVIEALALGRPVLVADTSGLHELAQRGWARAIPLQSTSQQVANAITEQFQDPLLPPSIQLPTWDDCTAALLELYQETIGEKQCAS
jgi:glycogen synthase